MLNAIADPIRLHILRSLRRHLSALVVTGVLREHPGESDGLTPGRPAARFSLDPEARESIVRLFASLR